MRRTWPWTPHTDRGADSRNALRARIAEALVDYSESGIAEANKENKAREALLALIALPRVHAVDLSLTVKGTDDVLRAAVRQNDSEMVQLAVHKGADPFEKDVNGRLSLIHI